MTSAGPVDHEVGGELTPHITTDDGVRVWYSLDGPEGGSVVMLSNWLGTELGIWAPQVPAFA